MASTDSNPFFLYIYSVKIILCLTVYMVKKATFVNRKPNKQLLNLLLTGMVRLGCVEIQIKKGFIIHFGVVYPTIGLQFISSEAS